MDLFRVPDEEPWRHVNRVFVPLVDKEQKAPSTITQEEQNIIDVYHSYGIMQGDGIDNLFLIDKWPRIVEAYRHVALTKAYVELSAVKDYYESFMAEHKTYSTDPFRHQYESQLEDAEAVLSNLEDSIMFSLSEYIEACARDGKIVLGPS